MRVLEVSVADETVKRVDGTDTGKTLRQHLEDGRKKRSNAHTKFITDRFRGIQLSRADLTKAKLIMADLWGADLREADLSGADLRGAILRSADLTKAKLSGANLKGAQLIGADLSEAEYSIKTFWPEGFVIKDSGLILVEKDDSPREPMIINDGLPLTFLIERGQATAEEISELYAELDILYRMLGGSGITFKRAETREGVPSWL